jgi:MFS transporter, FSR family, fosmidomycin resistance protein
MSTTLSASPASAAPLEKPQPAPGAPGGQHWRELWLITIGHSLTHWYPATFYLLLPIIGNELGLTFSQIGLIMTCQYIAGAVANIPGGVMVDTIGRKGLLMGVSLFWVGFPYLLMSFTHSYWMLLLCVSLVGVGNSLWHPTAIPTLAQRFPDRKGFVLSLHGMGGNAGDAVAPLVVGALLAVLSWREVVVLNVVPGLVMSLLILVFLGTLRLGPKKAKVMAAATPTGQPTGPLGSSGPAGQSGQTFSSYTAGLRQLLRNRSLILLSTSGAFRSMTQISLLTFLPLYMAREMGWNIAAVGLGMFTLQVAGLLASPVAGHLSDRLGRRSVLMGSMAMTAVLLLFMAVAGKSAAFIFFVAVLGFFLYAIRPVIQAWTIEATPKHMGGSAIGLLFGAQSAGASVAPLLGGIIADQWGLQATFYMLAATIVLANLFIFFVPAVEAHKA